MNVCTMPADMGVGTVVEVATDSAPFPFSRGSLGKVVGGLIHVADLYPVSVSMFLDGSVIGFNPAELRRVESSEE